MADAILYSFRRCPYAMRARMALAVSGSDHEHREVVLRDKPPELLEASPKATVPVLVAGERVIEESLEIMRWALARNDPENWTGHDDPALLDANDGPFKHHLDRYKYATRYEDVDPVEHRTACLAHLRKLDDRLAVSAYLCGDVRGFADIATFPFVRQFANADRDWFAAQDLAHVRKWLDGLTGSALFAQIMTKHPQWRAGS